MNKKGDYRGYLTLAVKKDYGEVIDAYAETANKLINGGYVEITNSKRDMIVHYDNLEVLFALAKLYGQFTATIINCKL